MTDSPIEWHPVTNEILLAMKDLAGIEFRYMQFQGGNFHVCGFIGDQKCIFWEVGFGTFGQTMDISLDVAETEMTYHLKRGVDVFTTEMFVPVDASLLTIPPFSTVEELRMKAKISGKDKFRTKA